jgi:hypothetical protein
MIPYIGSLQFTKNGCGSQHLFVASRLMGMGCGSSGDRAASPHPVSRLAHARLLNFRLDIEIFIRLPWLGQCGRAAAGCACTATALRC